LIGSSALGKVLTRLGQNRRPRLPGIRSTAAGEDDEKQTPGGRIHRRSRSATALYL
jgi:hypothetical protein